MPPAHTRETREGEKETQSERKRESPRDGRSVLRRRGQQARAPALGEQCLAGSAASALLSPAMPTKNPWPWKPPCGRPPSLPANSSSGPKKSEPKSNASAPRPVEKPSMDGGGGWGPGGPRCSILISMSFEISPRQGLERAARCCTTQRPVCSVLPMASGHTALRDGSHAAWKPARAAVAFSTMILHGACSSSTCASMHLTMSSMFCMSGTRKAQKRRKSILQSSRGPVRQRHASAHPRHHRTPRARDRSGSRPGGPGGPGRGGPGPGGPGCGPGCGPGRGP